MHFIEPEKMESMEPEQLPQYERDFQILKMHRLGIPQERIAHQTGLNQTTVAELIKQEEILLSPVRNALRQKQKPETVAKALAAPPALVWSLHLEGLSDEERFEKLGWDPQNYGHLYWENPDPRFGDEWPGRIPAELVGHTLRYCTKQGDLVMDPMAGGGVVSDVCLLFGRRCWSFDRETRQDRRPEIETYHWNIHQLSWPIQSGSRPTLIFFDPPDFEKKTKESEPDNIATLPREEYTDFFRRFFTLALNHVHAGGLIAFLNRDWRDFENKSAMEEDLSQALTVIDYAPLLQETGWLGPIIWSCPLSPDILSPELIEKLRELRNFAPISRSLLIGKRPD